jgi:hypothetical protein
MSSLLKGGVPDSGLDLSNPLVCAFFERLLQQQQQKMAQPQPAATLSTGGIALGADLPSIREVKRSISQSLRAR